MSLTLHALAMLCALGATAFASAPARAPWSSVAAVALGFVATAAACWSGRLPDAVWVGALVALVAAAQILRRVSPLAVAAAAGGLGAVWASLLHAAGLPWAAAAPVAAAPPMVSAFLASRRPRFAPAIVREEALLVIAVIGLAVAMVPDIQEGWRSAVALNIRVEDAGSQMIPGWAFALTCVSLVLGGLFSLWRRG